MFKPGESARVRATGETVTVKTVRREPLGSARCPIETLTGRIFEEAELHPAHPTVLATADGRHLATEDHMADIEARVAAHVAEHGEGMSHDLITKVERVFPQIATTLDWRGHWKNGSIINEGFKERLVGHLYLGSRAMTVRDAEDLVKAVESGVKLDRWVRIGGGFRLSLRSCSYCGEEGFDLESDGQTLRLSGEPCPYPEGLPPTEWELNVPSGKMVIANDLREAFPLPEGDGFDIDTTLGQRQTTLAYAANGMSHGFVGNSCPGVYKCKDGTYKITNPPQDEVWDDETGKYVKVKPKPKFDGKRVAGICTDLWWFSICDQDELERRIKHFKVDFREDRLDIVTVKPGVYRFLHNEEARRHEGPEECVYTRFEWVRDPDPVKDFLGQYQEVEVNPHAFVQAQVKRWPTLYGKVKGDILRSSKEEPVPWSEMTEADRYHAWQRVADHIFCTIGGGTDWHEKGFPQAKVDTTVPDIEPPSFRRQHHWYPFSKPYGGLWEPKKLAPSFAKLAFRVLESVISFGTDVNDGAHSREVPYVRQRMLLAVKRYRELMKKYPDQADPEYVWWLSQKGRAEKWVKSFDLGPVFTQKHRDHAASQRWVPEGTYAVEFDARKLKAGHFAGKHGWESPETAPNYALVEWSDNEQPPEHNCFWASHAINTAVPVYSVARVVKVGEVSHMGETLVEVAYDYGTPWMQDPTKRKAIRERDEKAGIRLLTKEEYEALLAKVQTEPPKKSKKPKVQSEEAGA
jgi:hypothetical protein